MPGPVPSRGFRRKACTRIHAGSRGPPVAGKLTAAGGFNRDSDGARLQDGPESIFRGEGSTGGRIEPLIRSRPPGGPQTDNNRRDQSGLDAAQDHTRSTVGPFGGIESVAMGGVCCPWRCQQSLATSGLAPSGDSGELTHSRQRPLTGAPQESRREGPSLRYRKVCPRNYLGQGSRRVVSVHFERIGLAWKPVT